jgi:Rrf2 family protein
MRLSRAAAYALQAVVYLARQEGGAASVPSHVIAGERKIPERYLLKVLKPLVSAQVLLSIRGPNGGYRLARPTGTITMLEVVEAVDGPLRGGAPPRPQGPDAGLLRRLDQVCRQLAEQARKALARVKVSDLAAG